jgi:hypothetical protein
LVQRLFMRGMVFLICLFFSIHSEAQANFGTQLKLLIGDSANGFKNFKAAFKELQETDSVFNSSIQFEETKKNDIIFSKGMSMYMAIVKDSVKEKQGKKIVDEWKDKILPFVGSSFKLKESRIADWNPAVYGWKFERGNVYIDIILYRDKYSNSSLCAVVFSIARHSGDL